MVYYTKQSEDYLERFRRDREDVTNNIPWKKQEHFPRSGNEGLYGFTYRHDGKIHVREDLIDSKRTETIIHESIHTPDEYETRRLTAWIMESFLKENNKYHKHTNYKR